MATAPLLLLPPVDDPVGVELVGPVALERALEMLDTRLDAREESELWTLDATEETEERTDEMGPPVSETEPDAETNHKYEDLKIE